MNERSQSPEQSESLGISLDLTIKSDLFAIPGGAVRRAVLQLQPYGFTGELGFWVTTIKAPDSLLPRFLSPDLATVKVTLTGSGSRPQDATDPLVLEGVVTGRKVMETTFSMRGNPVLVREYSVSFADPAAVLWRQHFPSLLDAETTLGDVIGTQVAGAISVDTSGLDVLGQARGLVCFNLGEGEASFYDFLLWLLDREAGGLIYDYASKKYLLVGSKPTPRGKPSLLRPDDVGALTMRLPDPPRHRSRVNNSNTASASTAAIDQDYAVDGIYRDRLVRTPIGADVDSLKAVEGLRLRSPLPEVEVVHRRWPWRDLTPGAGVGLQKELFSPDLFPVNRKFRVSRLDIRVESTVETPDDSIDSVSRHYRLAMTSHWESAQDKVFRHPPFRHPVYPCLAEGTIICDGGQTGDRTYMVAQDKSTAESFYKVQVPLWNKKVRTPLQPQFTAGHIYAPAFKDSRVLLALYLDRAEIVQFLDFGADVQLPSDSQGNQILFGRNKKSQTALTHAYVDNKPVFSVNRSCSGDLQFLDIHDGGIVLETKVDQSQASTSETFDLTPQAAAAKEEAAAAAQAAIAKVNASLAKSKAALSAKSEAAVGKTTAALDGLEAELKGKAAAAAAAIEGAVQDLGGKAAALQGAATGALGELRAKLGGGL